MVRVFIPLCLACVLAACFARDEVSPESMRVTGSVSPRSISLSKSDTLKISRHLKRWSPARSTWGRATLRFGPLQRHKHTVKFVVRNGSLEPERPRPKRPGAYRVVAYFGKNAAPPIELYIRP
jgi:hypothetical protein